MEFGGSKGSGDQLINHPPAQICQTEIPPGITVCEFLVIEPEHLQNRGVQIMNVNRILAGFESKIIGCAVNIAAFNAAAGHPHGKAAMVVIAAADFAGVGTGRRR